MRLLFTSYLYFKCVICTTFTQLAADYTFCIATSAESVIELIGYCQSGFYVVARFSKQTGCRPHNGNQTSWQEVATVQTNSSVILLLSFLIQLCGKALEVVGSWQILTNYLATSCSNNYCYHISKQYFHTGSVPVKISRKCLHIKHPHIILSAIMCTVTNFLQRMNSRIKRLYIMFTAAAWLACRQFQVCFPLPQNFRPHCPEFGVACLDEMTT